MTARSEMFVTEQVYENLKEHLQAKGYDEPIHIVSGTGNWMWNIWTSGRGYPEHGSADVRDDGWELLGMVEWGVYFQDEYIQQSMKHIVAYVDWIKFTPSEESGAPRIEKTTEFCDHCATEVSYNRRRVVEELPVNITSENKGGSATLCPSCHWFIDNYPGQRPSEVIET